jgi:hypothetical protein
MSVVAGRLIDVARDLCRRTGRRPREAFMRRAVSSAYYAMFHALCRLCADTLIGGAHWKTDAWSRVYRGLSHTNAKKTLTSQKDLAELPSEIASFGVVFALLQQEREIADYDPAPFQRYFAATETLVNQASSAIAGLGHLDDENRRRLAAMLLIRARQP